MKLNSRLFYSYLFFLVVYSGFTLLPTVARRTLLQYHLSVIGVRLIDFTVIVILAAIWFAGFYGYAKLQAYARLIQADKDGKQVAKLAKGTFLLVMWLPVSSTLSAVLNYFVMRHPRLLPATTIFNNYINLLFPLLGFILIGVGARGLSELVRWRPTYKAINVLAVLIIYIGVVYFRLVATTDNRATIYHISIWLILVTLAVPYIYMWFIGLLAAYEIYIYSQKTAGIVYRRAWSFLAIGIGWLIVTSISFQYLTTLIPRLSGLSIYWLLVIIYSLLLVLSAGFVLIAIGTRKLRIIEEV